MVEPGRPLHGEHLTINGERSTGWHARARIVVGATRNIEVHPAIVVVQYWRLRCGELQVEPLRANLHRAIKPNDHAPWIVLKCGGTQRICASDGKRSSDRRVNHRGDVHLRTNLGALVVGKRTFASTTRLLCQRHV